MRVSDNISPTAPSNRYQRGPTATKTMAHPNMSANQVKGLIPSCSAATNAAAKNSSANRLAAFLDIRGLISSPANYIISLQFVHGIVHD